MHINPTTTETDELPIIPIVDIFAGPGGLGEGFSAFQYKNNNIFKIVFSVEKDFFAHQTLMLRSFLRNFGKNKFPDEYYAFIRGEISLEDLYSAFPKESDLAQGEACHGTLGEIDQSKLDNKITKAINGVKNWVLIGGPPCQAYSTVGRSRNKGKQEYVPEKDDKHFLYKEYLRIIAHNWPAVFIMENVKGILSSKIKGNLIFPHILSDLKDPARAFNNGTGEKQYKYKIFSLAKPPDSGSVQGFPVYKNVQDYIIKSEEYGIPQTRHRVILLGIREDCFKENPSILKKSKPVSVKKIIGGLPKLRSGFSRGKDSGTRWLNWLSKIPENPWVIEKSGNELNQKIRRQIVTDVKKIKLPKHGRGGEYIPCRVAVDCLQDWYLDPKIKGVCNSTTRGHMDTDLYRYFYAACFSKVKKNAPVLSKFPDSLLPNHKNAQRPSKHGNFADRFRVQVSSRPSTTIMSHIAKDGHYYIHYDPRQCRSLTVREAARLQTFPDNYFFCGARTQQYTQVGNAVPPFLACQIAEVVFKVLFKR